MRFLCLVLVDEEKLAGLSKKEAQELDDISLDHDGKLRKRGKFLAAAALESVRASKMVRVKEGKVQVTDGPYAETKEQIGGFILIDAKDLDEAIEIASQIPAGQRLGGILVRPVKELTHSGKARN
ncbi:MAG TPA: YciI family protein [Candidatus Saccharimonadales bacterium]|nr:YciI family protein [Candidatus Saccharimonadales bacterium]